MGFPSSETARTAELTAALQGTQVPPRLWSRKTMKSMDLFLLRAGCYRRSNRALEEGFDDGDELRGPVYGVVPAQLDQGRREAGSEAKADQGPFVA